MVLFNGNRQPARLPIPAGRYSVILAEDQINPQGIRQVEGVGETLTVEVPASSALILVKK